MSDIRLIEINLEEFRSVGCRRYGQLWRSLAAPTNIVALPTGRHMPAICMWLLQCGERHGRR
jgi:hypothetical protein